MIGFPWTLAEDRRDAAWNAPYAELTRWLHTEGHLNLPPGQLRNWPASSR